VHVLQLIVDAACEHHGFHCRTPRLRKRFHPLIQIETGGGNLSFGTDLATGIFHAVADLPLMYIEADVIHRRVSLPLLRPMAGGRAIYEHLRRLIALKLGSR